MEICETYTAMYLFAFPAESKSRLSQLALGLQFRIKLLTFWRRKFIFNLSTSVYKILMIQTPNTLEL